MFIVDFEINLKLTDNEAHRKYYKFVKDLFKDNPKSKGFFLDMNLLREYRLEGDNTLLDKMQDKVFGDDNQKLNFLFERKRAGKLGNLCNFQDFNVQMYYIIIEKNGVHVTHLLIISDGISSVTIAGKNQ